MRLKAVCLHNGSGSRAGKPTYVTMPSTGMWKLAWETKLPYIGKAMTQAWILRSHTRNYLNVCARYFARSN